MRYRQLDANSDYVVGRPLLANSPACVAQAILTRLRLWKGEWFVDLTDGTPYLQSILGRHYGVNPDSFIKQRILGTQGVTAILAYSSQFDGAARQFTIQTTVATLYGTTPVTITI